MTCIETWLFEKKYDRSARPDDRFEEEIKMSWYWKVTNADGWLTHWFKHSMLTQLKSAWKLFNAWILCVLSVWLWFDLDIVVNGRAVSVAIWAELEVCGCLHYFDVNSLLVHTNHHHYGSLTSFYKVTMSKSVNILSVLLKHRITTNYVWSMYVASMRVTTSVMIWYRADMLH